MWIKRVEEKQSWYKGEMEFIKIIINKEGEIVNSKTWPRKLVLKFNIYIYLSHLLVLNMKPLYLLFFFFIFVWVCVCGGDWSRKNRDSLKHSPSYSLYFFSTKSDAATNTPFKLKTILLLINIIIIQHCQYMSINNT